MPAAKKLAGEMARVDGGLLKRMKAVIDDGMALPLAEALRMEIERGSANNATITPDSRRSRAERRWRAGGNRRASDWKHSALPFFRARRYGGTWPGRRHMTAPSRARQQVAGAGGRVFAARGGGADRRRGRCIIDGKRVERCRPQDRAGRDADAERSRRAGGLSAQVSVVIHKPVGIVSAQPERDRFRRRDCCRRGRRPARALCRVRGRACRRWDGWTRTAAGC